MRETILKIENIIDTAERMKNAYFWHGSFYGNASARSRMEERMSCPVVEWDDGKDHFTAEYNVRMSANNVYAQGKYTRNGNKTTLLAVKNSLKRLKNVLTD